MFVEAIRLFIRESVSLKGCHLGCHASQGIWRPECANVLQLRGETANHYFTFLQALKLNWKKSLDIYVPGVFLLEQAFCADGL